MKTILTLFITIIILSQALFAKALPEYALKAAYLYNFALLTQWVENNKTDEFNLCFYKKDFGEDSDSLKGKIIHNKELKILDISTLKEAKQCQIIFVRESEEENGSELIQELIAEQILIVSENENINNSHITILRDNNKLAFTVNMKRLKKTELVLSSKLLKLAKKVNQ